ncbi:MAG: hypothetical protein QHH06_12405 [Clostridiales bacterium]|nr:hypothetical protein [Eubacteriales bacterium]MDH7567252.1 hypothetical protein [Clostridiales bacterium]
MNDNYRLASLAKQDDLINEISRYENELTKRTGQDIVLIAYSKEK